MTTHEFTDSEAESLAGHFSNTDRNIFAITTPNQADRGALMSRYSRSPKGMRRIFLDEFLNNPNRGSDFYDNVLAKYGDDSVAELGFAQIALEGISNIAVQTIQDRRIGLSYLEKSSRYVAWDEKALDGKYQYYRGPDIMESHYEKAYENACNMSFDTYVKCMPQVASHLRESNPIDAFMFRTPDGQNVLFGDLVDEHVIKSAERAYGRSVKAAALDALRGLLPASTLTNLGVAGNGRAFEYLISNLRASNTLEERAAGDGLSNELKCVMGPFIRRADGPYGEMLENYIRSIQSIRGAASDTCDHTSQSRAGSRLVSCDTRQHAIDIIVAGLIYAGGAQTFGETVRSVSTMEHAKKLGIISRVIDMRQNRRHRPPRAFELISYVFDMEHNFGMYRDMHRHRMLTMQRHLLSTSYGFDVSPEVAAAGCAGMFNDCMACSRDAYNLMARSDPNIAQYVVNFAFRCRYMVRTNLRELCHLVELRSMPQGHRDYRAAVQEMYERMKRAHPELARVIKFVDTNDYTMGRIASESRVESKTSS